MPTLHWIGKNAVVNHHQTVPFRLLRANAELSVGANDMGNLLVEGDNLHALKALLPQYAGQVKCIYIDPPYNTGNEGWIYNDNVNAPEMQKWLHHAVGKEAEDLSRHDKWLCMMYPRLQLLRQFLREDGAIFISIDDNEVANLRLIMDEIFGQSNFIANVIWEKVYSPKSSARHLSVSHDYVLIYALNAEVWKPNLLPRTDEQDKRYKNPDNDPRGSWKAGGLDARNFYSEGTYEIITPSGRVISGPPKGAYWRVSKRKFEEMNADKRIWWGVNESNVPAIKRFLSEVRQGVVPQTIWQYSEAGHTQEAKQEIVDLISQDAEVFTTPKPTRLIKRILQLATDKDSIILDSFAGSGTTGHAVMQLNREDGGSRRFLLVEMEAHIARNVTAERLRRVICGVPASVGLPPPDMDIPAHPERLFPSEEETIVEEQTLGTAFLGGGFRYYTLGEPLFDAQGRLSAGVTLDELARHVFYTETGQALAGDKDMPLPLIGVANGSAIYLLWNRQEAEPLTAACLRHLPPHTGPKVVYAAACRLSSTRIVRDGITFRQFPYSVKK